MGTYNSPWVGDTFNYEAACADYDLYDNQCKSSFVPSGDNQDYVHQDKGLFIQGAIDARLDTERAKVIHMTNRMRQREWDACNAHIYRALVASTRPAELSVIRPHMGNGRAAWCALRATHAGSDNTRAGLTSAFIALSDIC